ncbi:carbonic anhydrase 1-like [Babylonia areolata]|uniref:carbonic anhydrase 1-like n=1 Tax=Babylonia areolata TaxID=304850 RepID=UPI003FD51725
MQSPRVVTACFFLSLLPFCQGTQWSYSDVNNWNTVYNDYCGGQKQSPIDLRSDVVQYNAAYLQSPFSFSNFDTVTGITWTLKNDGHSAKVELGGTAEAQVSGGSLPNTFQVAQFHFHWGSIDSQGSEHTVDGSFYPMEMHIVTYNTAYTDLSAALAHDDGLAVLGFFVEISETDNTAMASIVTGLSDVASSVSDTSINPVALSSLMADTANYYRYSGGLTTPTCNEVVTWTVFKDTIKISKTQLNAFRAMSDGQGHNIQDNYRPVQALNSRTITSSFPVSAASATGASALLLMLAFAFLHRILL